MTTSQSAQDPTGEGPSVDKAISEMRKTLSEYEENVRKNLDKLKQSGRYKTLTQEPKLAK